MKDIFDHAALKTKQRAIRSGFRDNGAARASRHQLDRTPAPETRRVNW
jgi:hypothetical protein